MDSLAGYLGTIDLNKRRVLRNKDDSISTEQSYSFSPDGQTEILIPQIINGVKVFRPTAEHHFFKTGEHLGVFDSTNPQFSYESLADYANKIHKRQDKFYNNK